LTDATGTPTLSEYSAAWLRRLETKLRPATVLRYRYVLERHMGALSAVPLAGITRPRLKDWIAGLHALGSSRKSMALYVAVVRSLLSEAFEDGLIPANPALGVVRAMRLPARTDDVEPLAFTADELGRVLEAAKKLFPRDGYACLLLMSHTGVRIGEALGVKWTDFDFEQRKLRISRQIIIAGIETPPKSARGRRLVDLAQLLIPPLRSLRARQLETALAAGREAGPYVIFPDFRPGEGTSNGQRARIESWLDRSVRGAGIDRHFHPHCLRHSFAILHVEEALKLQVETRIKWLCDQLGHATIKETLDTYVRHRQISDPVAADRFAQAIQARRQYGLFGRA
jgi:integrase